MGEWKLCLITQKYLFVTYCHFVQILQPNKIKIAAKKRNVKPASETMMIENYLIKTFIVHYIKKFLENIQKISRINGLTGKHLWKDQVKLMK